MIGEKLTMLLKKQGIKNNSAFAREVGITPQLLYKYMNNKSIPTIKILKKIAENLDVSIECIMEQDIDNEENQAIEKNIDFNEEIISTLTKSNEKALDHIIALGNALIKLNEKIIDKL